MPKLARFADRALDLLFDVTEPLAGRCAVCAFWRGVSAGAALVTALALVVLAALLAE